MDTFLNIKGCLYTLKPEELTILKSKIIPAVEDLYIDKNYVKTKLDADDKIIKIVTIDELIKLLFEEIQMKEFKIDEPVLVIIKNKKSGVFYRTCFINPLGKISTINYLTDQKFNVEYEIIKIASNENLKQYIEIVGYDETDKFSSLSTAKKYFGIDEFKENSYLKNLIENKPKKKASKFEICKVIAKNIMNSGLTLLDKDFLEKNGLINLKGSFKEKRFYMVKALLETTNPLIVIKKNNCNYTIPNGLVHIDSISIEF